MQKNKLEWTLASIYFILLEGEHANMNSQCNNAQQQQQSGNRCNQQAPDQNHKPQPGDGPDMQALPMPIPDPPIQYTKVSNMQFDLNCDTYNIKKIILKCVFSFIWYMQDCLSSGLYFCKLTCW